jgi:hypothetical protein
MPSFESLAQFQALIVADEAWVIAGAPDESALLDLLAGNGEGEWTQMPPTGIADQV